MEETGSTRCFVLGFESADHDPSPWMERALELCEEHGGQWDTVRSGGREGSVGAWREAFLRAPYLRDTFVAMGVLAETFETAITWERFAAFHETVTGAAQEAVRETYGAGSVTCRFTHVYPDGPAPVLHGARPRAPRRGARAVGDGQGGGLRRRDRGRRHDHAPPRGGPRPPPLVRPSAS